jgi:hypothetical protein
MQALGDESQFLLGDWGGLRTRLADHGVDFDFEYTGEAAHNFSGGNAHLTRYADQWKAGATLDLARLWNLRGAQFEVVVTDRNGRRSSLYDWVECPDVQPTGAGCTQNIGGLSAAVPVPAQPALRVEEESSIVRAEIEGSVTSK